MTPAVLLAALMASAARPQDEKEEQGTPEAGFQQDVAWSPDGEWLAFSEYSGGEPYDASRWAIHAVRADGSERRRLVEHAKWVSWSPDGKALAFSSDRSSNEELYRCDREGGSVENLTEHPARDSQPAWSPGGEHVAFVSDRDGKSSLFLLALEDGAVERLTSVAARDYNPAWSPDGKHLVFYREQGDGQDQIHVLELESREERPITRDTHLNTFPSFLPDGRIAFASRPEEGEETVVTVDPEGNVRRDLGLEAFFARWSPDGTRIAFLAGTWPRSTLCIARADGTGARPIVP